MLDVTHADSHAQVHLQERVADHGASAVFTFEARKRQHYARTGHVCFDERSHALATAAVWWKGLGVSG